MKKEDTIHKDKEKYKDKTNQHKDKKRRQKNLTYNL